MLTRLKSLESPSFSLARERNFSTSENRDYWLSNNRPIVSGIIVTCRSALAISRSLVCFTAAMARIPDAQTPQWQWRIWVCKCCHFSLPLYRKQERSLFTAVLEQTSDVPTTRDVSRLSGHVRRRACGFPVPGIWSVIASPVAFPACFLTRAPRRQRPGLYPGMAIFLDSSDPWKAGKDQYTG